MKRLLLIVFLITGLFTTAAIAQEANPPVINKYSFSDYAVLGKVSDNGHWCVAQAATSDGINNGMAKLLDLTSPNTADGTVVIQSSEDVIANGACTIGDVTDDGNIVVGSYKNVPAYWNKTTKQWTLLPVDNNYAGGSLTAVTPDGKYAVGSLVKTSIFFERGVVYDLTTNKEVTLTNVPVKDMGHEENGQSRFVDISVDGRYVLARMSFSYIAGPTCICSYLYDIKNQSYKFIGFTPDDTNDWTPVVDRLEFIDAMAMSPNGKYVVAWARIVNGTGNEYYVASKYNVESGETEVYNGTADSDVAAFTVDDNGTVYAASPAESGARNWYVRYGNYWYSITDILKQVYNIDLLGSTNYSNTGTPLSTSADGKSISVMVDPQSGESYNVVFPEPLKDVCAKVNLLGNYSVTPADGSTFTRLTEVSLMFTQNVTTTGQASSISLKDENGTFVKNASGLQVDATNKKGIVITFRGTDLEAGKKYTINIPAGVIGLEGESSKTNEAITINYVGRANEPMKPLSIRPEDGSVLASLGSTSNYVQMSFDATVKKSDTASAELYRTDDNVKICDLSIVTEGNNVAVYPASTQYLYLGANYKVVINAGSITDVSGKGGNEQIELNYKGSYERQISYDNQILFSDDFADPSQSYLNFMRYEGDHNTPTSAMKAIGFEDADNYPWNFLVKESNESSDWCAASTSMYSPAGQSDDWMVIPQLEIPDKYCSLTFKAQSYKKDKADRLKVLVWTAEENVQTLTEDVMKRIKAEAETVYDEQLTPGESEEELSNDWVNYTVDLSKYSGKKIYICFLNDNNDQSMVLVDNIMVQRSMKYLASLSNEQSVVNKDNIDISGTITANSDNDVFHSMKLTLKDMDGNVVDELTYDGLALKKGDSQKFAFTKPLPLKKNAENKFTIGITLDDYSDVISSSVKNLAFEPVKRILLEEITGTTCINCPLGILAIEKMKELYGDKLVVVSAHTYTGDQLGSGLSSYTSALGLSSAPAGIINRNGIISSPMWQSPLDAGYYFNDLKDQNCWMDVAAKEMETPAEAEISATVNVNASTLEIPVTVRYALDADNLNLSLFPVVLEDSIMSFQTNKFYGTTDANLGEWGAGGIYAAPEVNGIYHNDVLRYFYGSSINGINYKLPTSMLAGNEYRATLTGELPSNISNINHAKVVVVMIDANTGRYINSVEAKFPGYTSGIESVESEGNNIQIGVTDGNITVNGTKQMNVSVYTLTGTQLAAKRGSGNVNVSVNGYKGAVIVKAVAGNSTTVKKLLVK